MNDDKPFEVLKVKNGLDEIRWIVRINLNKPGDLYVANDEYLHIWTTTDDMTEAYRWRTEKEAATGGRIWYRQKLESEWEFVPLDETIPETMNDLGQRMREG